MKELTYKGKILANYEENDNRIVDVTLPSKVSPDHVDFIVQSLAVLAYKDRDEPLGFTMIVVGDCSRRDFFAMRGDVDAMLREEIVMREEVGNLTGRQVLLSVMKPNSLEETTYALNEEEILKRLVS